VPSSLIERHTWPVDPELFLWCSGIYSGAAQLAMPVQNPAAKPVVEHDGKVYSLSDIPINRGILAVMKELREHGASEDVRKSMVWRLMHFGEVLEKPALSAFIRPGDEPGAVSVSEALIKACATAKFILTGDDLRFDVDDIARIAQELTDAEKAEDSAQ
jgi:hypothetical protein